MKSRIFLAINIPLEIREDIDNIYLKLAKYLPKKGVKQVSKHNLHITLHFLGDQTAKKIEQIKEITKKSVVDFNPFIVSLGDIDAFPNKSFPRIIVLTIDRGVDDLKKLKNTLSKGLKEIGIKIDERGLKAHITLARIKFGKADFREIDINKENVFWEVNECDLVESKLTDEGPIYNILEHFAL